MADRILTADEILAAQDLEERIVEVPEWGGAVKIRGLTKAAQQQVRRQATGPDGQVDADRLEILMLAACVIEPQFTEEQVERLKQKSATAVDRVLQAVLDLAGLSPEAVKQAQKSFRPGTA